jgi:aminopeptidase N
MASQIASTLEFMASRFGPPALPHLTVSPIPGAFGQGFPGLIYLSTISYLRGAPAGSRFTEEQQLFFQEILQAHETAHQWWGSRVNAAAYRDNWLMEALANYSALLYLEKTKGRRAMELMLEQYREELLSKNEAGMTVESVGPIVLGTRLESSIEPRAWAAITYGKGSWILHMLRERMGDAKFLAMLAELARRYDRQEISTEDFRLLAAKFAPKSEDPKLEAFFDQWVYGSGIPTLKLSYSVKGKAPALRLVGTITQTGVQGDFSTAAPVEVQFARGRPMTQWVQAGPEPVNFTIPLKQTPAKVLLDPGNAVLRTK